MDDRLKRWPTLPRQDPCVVLRELLAAIAMRQQVARNNPRGAPGPGYVLA